MPNDANNNINSLCFNMNNLCLSGIQNMHFICLVIHTSTIKEDLFESLYDNNIEVYGTNCSNVLDVTTLYQFMLIINCKHSHVLQKISLKIVHSCVSAY